MIGMVPALEAQSAKDIVQQAVQTELAASRNDRSHWRFRQQEKLPISTVSIVVQTAHGAVTQKVEQNGRPLSPNEIAAEAKRIQNFIHDPSLQQKQKHDAEQDDKSAAELLTMLPMAFTWTVASETPQSIVLAFKPDTSFQPPDMEARVMSTMAGQLVIDRAQHRIHTMRGTLTQDVNIGFGLLGKLHQGGTFNVERRELMPGLWQITETHVHIDGRALLFKTIGQQQDEINSDFTRVPDATTLEQALTMLPARNDAGCGSCSTLR